jgi:hypothetical protein
MFVRLYLAALWAAFALPAWAQDAACPGGEPCNEELRWGAWGMIGLGLLFFAVWFIPNQPPREDESGNTSLPLIGRLQVRIQQELTGWRRWQWPLLGIFFIGIGIASLSGWR